MSPGATCICHGASDNADFDVCAVSGGFGVLSGVLAASLTGGGLAGSGSETAGLGLGAGVGAGVATGGGAGAGTGV